jgi:cellulose synthase/poly-beta-1,6-N-acetylglucosamine synthase-like glycosyltransferase
VFWTFFCFLLTFAYVGLMLTYWYGWKTLPEQSILSEVPPGQSVTVVVAARNEANHIGDCLSSIARCQYPLALLEIIVVNDHSTDNTAAVVQDWLQKNPVLQSRFRLISLEHPSVSGKKAAIEYAVAQASGQIILLTDADCVVSENWISAFAGAFQQNADKMLFTGPVVFYQEKNWLERFQSLDFMGLMGITGAGLHLGFQRMGNGANLGFLKDAFLKIGGYSHNSHLASGDDMFLIQNMEQQYPGSTGFLKNRGATVRTTAQPTLLAFIRQRIRWGGKNAALPEWPIRLALLAVFLFCMTILYHFFYSLYQFFHWANVLTFGSLGIVQVMAKCLADYLLLSTMCRYFNRKDLLQHFWLSFILHTLYIPIIGLLSLIFRRYKWKGRVTR